MLCASSLREHILSHIATDTHAHVRTRSRTHTHLRFRYPQYHRHTHTHTFRLTWTPQEKFFFLDGSLHHGWHNFVSLVSQLSAVQLSIPSCSIIPVEWGCGPQDYMLAASSSVTLDLSSSTSLSVHNIGTFATEDGLQKSVSRTSLSTECGRHCR